MANKKKQKLSFAQRAERIMKKYEARPDDTAAQDSKNRELSVLQEEQKLEMQNRAMEAAETMKSLGYGHMLASDEPQQGPPQPSQEEMMAMQQQQAMMQQQGQGMPQGQQMAAYGGHINRYKWAKPTKEDAEAVNKVLPKWMQHAYGGDINMYHSGGEVGHTHDDTKMGPNPYNNINAAREKYEIARRKFKPKGFKKTKYHLENLPEAEEYREALRNAPKHVLEQYDINRSKHYSSPIEMLKDFDERNTTKTKAPIENYNIYDDYKASTDSLNELAFLEQQAELGKHTGAMANNYDHFKDRADYASYKTDMSPSLKKYYDDNIKKIGIEGQQGFYHSPDYAIPKKNVYNKKYPLSSSNYFSEDELKAKGTAEKAAKAKADKERAEYNKIVAAGGRNFIESKAYGGHMNKYAPGGEFEAESVNPWIAAGQLAPDVYGLAQNLRPGDDFTSKKMDSNIYTDTSAEEAAIDRATGSAGAGLRENLRRLGSAGAKSAAVTGATQIATGAGAQKAGVISQAQQLDDKTNLGIEAQNNALINADAQFNMQQEGARRTATEQYLRNIGQETVPGIALDQTQNEMQAAIIKALGSGDYAYEGGIEDLILAFQGGQAKKGE